MSDVTWYLGNFSNSFSFSVSLDKKIPGGLGKKATAAWERQLKIMLRRGGVVARLPSCTYYSLPRKRLTND